MTAHARNVASSVSTRPVTTLRVSPSTRSSRCSTAARSRRGSPPPTVMATSSRAASWDWSARSSPRTTCARSRASSPIGHVRYSTTGSNAWENSQPVHRSQGTNGSRREVALAHNGNLINAVELHEELVRTRRHLRRDLGLRDHRGADRDPSRERARGRDRGGPSAAARRLLDRGDDEGPSGCVSRSSRHSAARARRARRGGSARSRCATA